MDNIVVTGITRATSARIHSSRFSMLWFLSAFRMALVPRFRSSDGWSMVRS